MDKILVSQAISNEDPQDLGLALRALSGNVVLFHQAVADALGLQPSDHKCAEILAAGGAMTAGDLAERTGLTTGTITAVIDRLEAMGVAERRRDRDDRRKVFVVPNPAFTQRIASLFAPLARATDTLLKQYSPEQLALVQGFVRQAQTMMETETRRLKAAAAGDSAVEFNPTSDGRREPRRSE
jgi:DNA-binding MarR family transcriptional regulator